MSNEVFAALLALVGSMVGSLGGILASARLTKFRLQQLEKKVEKHNNLVERMAKVEASAKSAHNRLDEIKREK